MDQGPKCKSYSYKTEENIDISLCDFGLGKDFLNIPKT